MYNNGYRTGWPWRGLATALVVAILAGTGLGQVPGQALSRTVSTAAELRSALADSAALQLPLTITLLANINFDYDNWPDPPVVVTQSVTIISPYRSKLDFCGSQGGPARPLINVTSTGSMLLQKVFLRNFLPTVPQDLSGLGPVPALLSSGGVISFKFVVFHFLPAVTWVFNSSAAPGPPNFWARNSNTSMRNLYTFTPPQFTTPAIYTVRFQTPPTDQARYFVDSCFAPMDLRSCYGDDREDTTLIYCLYTLADSLRNPSVKYARIFQDIGLDRAAYAMSNPIVLRQAKSYSACPESAPSLNMDGIFGGVVVQASLEFSGVRFKGSAATNFTLWPPAVPVLLSVFSVQTGGALSISDSVIEVADLPATVTALRALPSCCRNDPSRPNLQPDVDAWPSAADLAAATARMRAPPPAGGGVIVPAWPTPTPPTPDAPSLAAPPAPPVNLTADYATAAAAAAAAAGSGVPGVAASLQQPPGFIITQWLLSLNSWLLYSSPDFYASLSSPSSAKWRFTNVLVQQADMANERALCFSAPMEQGATQMSHVVHVANESQLREALQGARYIRIVNDIKLTPELWPSGSRALVPSGGMIEVRACHPVYGSRYTFDASDLQTVIRATGSRLIFQGDLRFVGVGWTTVPDAVRVSIASSSRDVSLLGAFSVATSTQGARGSLEFERARIEGQFIPNGFTPGELLAIMHLSHMTPAIRSANVSLNAGEKGLTLGFWTVGDGATESGSWVFTQTELTWQGDNTSAGGSASPTGQQAVDIVGGSEDIKKIVVPCVVVGSVLLIAVVALSFAFVRCRSRRAVGGTCPVDGKAFSAVGVCKDRGSGGDGRGSGGDGGRDYQKSLSSSLAQALAQAPGLVASADGNAGAAAGGDAKAAAALAAVLHAASKMLNTSNQNSNISASGTKTDLSGAAVAAAALAALERMRTEKDATVAGPASTDGRGAGRGGGAGAKTSSRDKDPLADITAVKKAIMAGRPMPNPEAVTQLDDLVLLNVLGEGSYGRVYQALWRGTAVAVKVIMLPASMSGKERHERMAVMEAAISSSLSHPNIVQTYTYVVESVEGAKARSTRAHGSHGPKSGLPESSTAPFGGPDACGVPRAITGGDGDNDLDVVGWEIRLVQEFCDLGSLRDKLNAKAFFKCIAGAHVALPTPPQHPGPVATASGRAGLSARVASVLNASGAHPLPPPPPAAGPTSAPAPAVPVLGTAAAPPSSPASAVGVEYVAGAGVPSADGGSDGNGSRLLVVDLEAVLDTAIDVARAVTHLHRQGIVHADLKPRNVLLKGSTTDPRGFVAKVADFGLSTRLDPNETHVSNAYHGTLAYMAPETLLHGHVSRASDVYGFGIMLYEIYTGETAFRGVPKALIGHAITKENLRPIFPPALGAPFEYQLLACRCWESNPEIRPEFEFILEDLKRMRNRLCAPFGDNSSVSTAAGPTHCIPASINLPTANGGYGGVRSRLAGATGSPLNNHQDNSQQGGHILMMSHTGGSFSDGERTLSMSNSVTMSAMSATAGHSSVSPITPSADMLAGMVMARQLMGAGSRGAPGAVHQPPLTLAPVPAAPAPASLQQQQQLPAATAEAAAATSDAGRVAAHTCGARPRVPDAGTTDTELEGAEEEEVRIRSL